jgi:hypothetical protein
MNLESNFEKNKSPELMSMPEVKYENNSGYFWYTLLRKKLDSDWESLNAQSNETSEKINNSLSSEEINHELKNKWEELKLEVNNDEILLWFSLAVENDDFEYDVFQEIKKHKDLNDAEEKFERFKSIIREFKSSNFEAGSLIEDFAKKDIQNRQEKNEEEKIVSECIKYFKPKKDTSNIEKIVFLPTNPLIREDTGSGFFSETNKKGIIFSNIENSGSKRHEFLHFIINPITEKIDFTKEEKAKIIKIAGKNLVEKQNYGEHPHSLLNEILIRFYNGITEHPEITEDDLKNKREKNIFNFYKNFGRENNENLTFEDYFLENYKELLNI